MALVRRRPWGDMVGIQSEMNRLFDDSFDHAPARWRDAIQKWSPAVDISEDKDNVYVDVEIPGMNKEDIKVSLENNVLSLKGEKKHEKEVREEDYHRWERRSGSFARAFELPVSIQSDKISASYENGVMRVALPKAEEVKPKEIPIEVN